MVPAVRAAGAPGARLRAAAGLTAVFALATTVGPTADTSINDLYVYSVQAGALRDGLFPYREFAFEYPPLALVPIAIAGGSAVTLALIVLACLLATQWWLGALAGPRAAWLFALAPLACGAMVRTHFDALPAALAVAALLGLLRERPRLAFALLGAGGMVKLWPLLLVPVFAAWLLGRGGDGRRTALQGTAIAAAVCLALLAPFAGAGLVDTARFHLDRPVQIESTPATVLATLGGSYVTGAPVRPDPYKSNGLAGGSADAVELAFVLALIAALLAAVVLARRDLVLASFLVVLAFVALGKVLSPQFMVWLAPFAVLALCRRDPLARAAGALTALAIAVTQLEFPSRYFDLVSGDTATFVLVGARNALLLAAATALVAALARSRPPVAAPSSAPPRP